MNPSEPLTQSPLGQHTFPVASMVPAVLRERVVTNRPFPPGIIEQRQAVVARIRTDSPEQDTLLRIVSEIDKPEVMRVVLNTLYDPLIEALAEAGAIVTDMSMDHLTAVFLLESSTQAGRVYQALVSVENALQYARESTPAGYPDYRWKPAAGVGIGAVAVAVVHGIQRKVFLLSGLAMQQAEEALLLAEDGQVIAHRDVMKRLGSAVTGSWVQSNYFLPKDSFSSNVVGQMISGSSPEVEFVRQRSLSLDSDQEAQLLPFLDANLLALQDGYHSAYLTYLIVGVDELSLFNESDLERWQVLLDKVLGIVAQYSGAVQRVVPRTGYGEIHIVFTATVDDENTERRIVSCALALQRSLHAIEPSLQMGIGGGGGFVGLLGNEYYSHHVVVGLATREARRLVQAASAREALVTQTIQQVTKDAYSWRQLSEDAEIYALAGEVSLGSGLAARIQVSKQTPLIGREEEIDTFKQIIEECHAGSSRMVIVSGKSGHGRSALIDALIDQWLMADGNGFLSIGPSHTPAAPYSLWFPIWQAAFDLIPEADPEENLSYLETAFTRLLPEFDGGTALFADVLGLVRQPAPEIVGLSAPARHQRLLDANAALFRQISALTPTLLAFEHLEYADSLSLELLDELINVLADERVLICLEDRRNITHSLHRYFQRATVIEAKPLSGNSAWQLFNHFVPPIEWPYSHKRALEERLGKADDTETSDGVAPAYVVALATGLSHSALQRQGQTWTINTDYAPQDWPRDTIETTNLLLETALTQTEGQLAIRASVAGMLFYHQTPWLRLTVTDSSLQLGRMRSLRLTEPYIDLGHPRRWDRFRHEGIREALYHHLDSATRAELHGMVAAWHREHQPGMAGQAAVAYHIQQAGLSLEAVAAYLKACEHAAAWGAEAEASQNLLAAERLLSQQTSSDARQAFIQVYLTRAQLYLSAADYSRGLMSVNRALAEAEAQESVHLQTSALLLRARFHQLANDYEQMMADTSRAIELTEAADDKPVLAEALWLQARALHATEQRQPAARLLTRALQQSTAVRNVAVQVEMELDAADILLQDYHRDRAQEHVSNAYRHAQKLGDSVVLHQVLTWVGHMNLLYGRAEAAVEALERALGLPAPPDAGLGALGELLADHATALCYLGRYTDAESAFEAAISYHLIEDDQRNILKVELTRANQLYLDRNDFEAAQMALDQAKEQRDLLSPLWQGLLDLTQVAVHTQQQQFSEAETLLDAWRALPDSLTKHWYWPLYYVRRAELALTRGNPNAAVIFASKSLGSVSIRGDLRFLTVAYCLLAEAMILRGDKSDTIQDALERAVHSGRGQGRRLHLARALYLLGQYLRRMSVRYSTRARGSTFLFEADLLFKEMDVSPQEQVPEYMMTFWGE